MDKTAQRVSNIDVVTRAQNLSLQLDAQLTVTTGEVGDSFRMLSDVLQNNFLWACSDMAGELANILNELEVRHG